MLGPFDLTGKQVLADKGYDNEKWFAGSKSAEEIPTIPSRDSARRPRKWIGAPTKSSI